MSSAVPATAADSTPAVDDVVRNSVDFRGRPSVRSRSGCWKSASFALGVEMAERFSLYGVSSNLLSYLTVVLGQSTATAAANLNAWYGTAALLPILGAFVGDSFLGRYRTVIFSSLLYILGLGFLTLSAVINSFNPPDSENAAINTKISSSTRSQLHTIFFFFSLYLVALAQGGHKPCLQAFGADQFDVEDKQESEAKSTFFNWYFWFSCFGILLAFLILNYIQDNISWAIGFGIPTAVMCFTLILFLIGTMTYRFRVNGSGRQRRTFWGNTSRAPPQECDQSDRSADIALLTHGDPTEDDLKTSSKIDIKQEAKAILELVPIWSTCLGLSIVYAQPSTLFTKQATTLDRRIISTFQLPAASLQLFIPVSIVIFIPIYDRVLVPIFRAITKNPSGISKLQRIGTGLFLSLTSISVAALVERKRLLTAIDNGLVDMPKAVVPMSLWWLVPQYALSGLADVFAMAGLQEFFYDEVPSEMKSFGIALFLSVLGVGSFLSSFLVSVIQKVTSADGRDGWFADNLNRAHLDYFYWFLAGISALLLAAFVYFAKSFGCGRKSCCRFHLRV